MLLNLLVLIKHLRSYHEFKIYSLKWIFICDSTCETLSRKWGKPFVYYIIKEMKLWPNVLLFVTIWFKNLYKRGLLMSETFRLISWQQIFLAKALSGQAFISKHVIWIFHFFIFSVYHIMAYVVRIRHSVLKIISYDILFYTLFLVLDTFSYSVL